MAITARKCNIIFLGAATAAGYLTWGLLIALQPPFYPYEAEQKGATPQQYGFVFGIFNLAAVITAPIFGKYGTRIGPKLLYSAGAIVLGVCGFLFGFLEYIDDVNLFIGLSYLLRGLTGVADAACWSAVLSLLLQMFPDKVAKTMALTETSFGLGLMIGPALGSLLFEAGGFKLPFFVVGGFACVVALILPIALARVEAVPEQVEPADETTVPLNPNGAHVGNGRGHNTKVASADTNGKAGSNGQATPSQQPKISYGGVFKHPTLILPFIDNFICFFGNGFIEGMLQPYAVTLGATLTEISMIFLAIGLCYMICTPIAGFVLDRLQYPVAASMVANCLLIISFTLLAPLPFLPIEPSFSMMMVCASLCGVGYAISNVGSFTRAQKAAQRVGFSADLDTYIMISGLFASSLFMGNFLGPTLSGFLVESLGFPGTSIIFWGCYIGMLVLNSIDFIYQRKAGQSARTAAYEQLF